MRMAGQAIWSGAIPITDAGAEELEGLVREHAALVYRVVYVILRNHHDAEDATQETFLRVLRYGKRLASVRNPRAWLARVAWRVALDRRRSAPEVSLQDAAQTVLELKAAGRTPEEIAAESQMAALLERLLATLPHELREALALSTVEEMSSADIAAVLEIPEATVRTRLLRARQLLREKLVAVLGGRHGR